MHRESFCLFEHIGARLLKKKFSAMFIATYRTDHMINSIRLIARLMFSWFTLRQVFGGITVGNL